MYPRFNYITAKEIIIICNSIKENLLYCNDLVFVCKVFK